MTERHAIERREDPPRLLVILGPTATGKSDLGVELAERLGGEIINADALQVYRDLEIGTAKATAEMRARVPHHLVDILDPEERFSAGEFARLARAAARDIAGRSRVPIVVGGSGLYLRALIEGISPMPPTDPAVRADLEARLAGDGLPALYAELERTDPETAARLAPGDRQRILRALEVLAVSGRPQSEWVRLRPFGERALPAVRIGLTLPRAILYDRIAERVKAMADGGWVEEVAAMLRRGIHPTAPAFQAIGYRQIVGYLQGDWSLEQALADTVQATRRYAKRQLTWFRREEGIHWVSALNSSISSLAAQALVRWR